MANKRIIMRKVRELLRLRFEKNISARKAAKIIGIGKIAASQYVSDFKASGLKLSAVPAMSDSELLVLSTARKNQGSYVIKSFLLIKIVFICNIPVLIF